MIEMTKCKYVCLFIYEGSWLGTSALVIGSTPFTRVLRPCSGR